MKSLIFSAALVLLTSAATLRYVPPIRELPMRPSSEIIKSDRVKVRMCANSDSSTEDVDCVMCSVCRKNEYELLSCSGKIDTVCSTCESGWLRQTPRNNDFFRKCLGNAENPFAEQPIRAVMAAMRESERDPERRSMFRTLEKKLLQAETVTSDEDEEDQEDLTIETKLETEEEGETGVKAVELIEEDDSVEDEIDHAGALPPFPEEEDEEEESPILNFKDVMEKKPEPEPIKIHEADDVDFVIEGEPTKDEFEARQRVMFNEYEDEEEEEEEEEVDVHPALEKGKKPEREPIENHVGDDVDFVIEGEPTKDEFEARMREMFAMDYKEEFDEEEEYVPPTIEEMNKKMAADLTKFNKRFAAIEVDEPTREEFEKEMEDEDDEEEEKEDENPIYEIVKTPLFDFKMKKKELELRMKLAKMAKDDYEEESAEDDSIEEEREVKQSAIEILPIKKNVKADDLLFTKEQLAEIRSRAVAGPRKSSQMERMAVPDTYELGVFSPEDVKVIIANKHYIGGYRPLNMGEVETAELPVSEMNPYINCAIIFALIALVTLIFYTCFVCVRRSRKNRVMVLPEMDEMSRQLINEAHARIHSKKDKKIRPEFV